MVIFKAMWSICARARVCVHLPTISCLSILLNNTHYCNVGLLRSNEGSVRKLNISEWGNERSIMKNRNEESVRGCFLVGSDQKTSEDKRKRHHSIKR